MTYVITVKDMDGKLCKDIAYSPKELAKLIADYACAGCTFVSTQRYGNVRAAERVVFA